MRDVEASRVTFFPLRQADRYLDSNTPVAAPMPVPKEPIGICLAPFKVGHIQLFFFFLGGSRDSRLDPKGEISINLRIFKDPWD